MIKIICRPRCFYLCFAVFLALLNLRPEVRAQTPAPAPVVAPPSKRPLFTPPVVAPPSNKPLGAQPTATPTATPPSNPPPSGRQRAKKQPDNIGKSGLLVYLDDHLGTRNVTFTNKGIGLGQYIQLHVVAPNGTIQPDQNGQYSIIWSFDNQSGRPLADWIAQSAGALVELFNDTHLDQMQRFGFTHYTVNTKVTVSAVVIENSKRRRAYAWVRFHTFQPPKVTVKKVVFSRLWALEGKPEDGNPFYYEPGGTERFLFFGDGGEGANGETNRFDGKPGITAEASMATSSINQVEWVQKIVSTRTDRIHWNGTPIPPLTFYDKLDTQYPYGGYQTFTLKDSPAASAMSVNTKEIDRHDVFDSWFMWRYNPDSIWIPMYKMRWKWNGKANETPLFLHPYGIWQLDPSFRSNPFTATVAGETYDPSYPEWKDVMVGYNLPEYDPSNPSTPKRPAVP